MRIVNMIALLSLAAVPASAQPTDWSHAQPITITLSNFAFAPKRIELTHGQAYRLQIVNGASGGHNFVARNFFAAARIAPQDQRKIDGGKIDLGGGESADINLVAGAPGTYDLHCSHLMHSAFGMTGEIVVR